VWANPELFLLDDQRKPRFVAACRRIISARRGSYGATRLQLGGTAQTGYRWCIDRLRALLAHVDVIRLDHFPRVRSSVACSGRGTYRQSGQWVPGPGADFFNAVKKELGGLPFIAEDLGLITADVNALVISFMCLGPVSCNLPSTAIRITPTSRTTTSRTRSYIPGPHDNATSRGGTKSCHHISGRICGVT
jgi:4-alpha-glucanotransferase